MFSRSCLQLLSPDRAPPPQAMPRSASISKLMFILAQQALGISRAQHQPQHDSQKKTKQKSQPRKKNRRVKERDGERRASSTQQPDVCRTCAPALCSRRACTLAIVMMMHTSALL